MVMQLRTEIETGGQGGRAGQWERIAPGTVFRQLSCGQLPLVIGRGEGQRAIAYPRDRRTVRDWDDRLDRVPGKLRQRLDQPVCHSSRIERGIRRGRLRSIGPGQLFEAPPVARP